MKKIILPLILLTLSVSAFAQKRDTEGMKKISQPAYKNGTDGLTGLSELASLAQLGSLAQLSSLADLSSLAELGNISVLVDEDFTVIIPETSLDLQEELSTIHLDLDNNLNVEEFVNYGELVDQVLKEVISEFQQMDDDQ